jgi:hypothetical protein
MLPVTWAQRAGELFADHWPKELLIWKNLIHDRAQHGVRIVTMTVTYFLEKPFTNWTRTSAESLTCFSLILSLDASLSSIREQVGAILRANPLWNAGRWEVMVSELGESSMVVRITLGGANPEVAFQLKSQVQEHLLDYLNRYKKGSLVGAVPDPMPAA